MSNNQGHQEIGKVININKDACEFYGSAQKKTDSPIMKQTFRNLEHLHKSVMTNLQNYVQANGGSPEPHETIIGQAQKFWGELMTEISNDIDETLVTHLEEAEDRCLHSIKDIIQKDSVSPSTKSVLQQELGALQKSHDYMKSLKDCMKAA